MGATDINSAILRTRFHLPPAIDAFETNRDLGNRASEGMKTWALLFLPGDAIRGLVNAGRGGECRRSAHKTTGAVASREPELYAGEIFLAPTKANRKVPHYVDDFGTGAPHSAG